MALWRDTIAAGCIPVIAERFLVRGGSWDDMGTGEFPATQGARTQTHARALCLSVPMRTPPPFFTQAGFNHCEEAGKKPGNSN